MRRTSGDRDGTQQFAPFYLLDALAFAGANLDGIWSASPMAGDLGRRLPYARSFAVGILVASAVRFVASRNHSPQPFVSAMERIDLPV